MNTQQVHAAVLHGIGQTPRYELFPAPLGGGEKRRVVQVPSDETPGEEASNGHSASRSGAASGENQHW